MMTVPDEVLFFESMAQVQTRDFMVLAVGLLAMRLWRGLPADRLNPEQVHAIEAALAATDEIPDTWQSARAALRDVFDAVTSMESDVTTQAAFARYAAGIARLAPEIAALVLRRLQNASEREHILSYGDLLGGVGMDFNKGMLSSERR